MQNSSIFNLIVEKLPSNDAQRLFHGRGGLFKGWEQINIEVYPPVLWVMIYQEVDETELVAALNEIASQAQALQLDAIYIQRRYQKDDPVEVFFGSNVYLNVDHQVNENDLSYWVNLGRNQNTGLFLDMCAGRDWVKQNAEDKKVLNLFSYTCSLGIAAAAGNANSVVNIDMAKGAIKRGQQNLALNNVPCVRNTFIAQDVFKMIKKLTQKGPFDLLIADPPSFQSKAFDVKKDYEKLLHKLKPALSPGAQIMLCLNSPALTTQFLHDLVGRVFDGATFIKRIENPAFLADQNEEHSLKVMLYQI